MYGKISNMCEHYLLHDIICKKIKDISYLGNIMDRTIKKDNSSEFRKLNIKVYLSHNTTIS